VKLYLAGAMRGKPAYNAAAFGIEAIRLRSAGYRVVTPIEIDRRVCPTFCHYCHVATAEQVAQFQAASMAELATCDGVALLDGWEASAGTAQEIALARSLRLTVGTVDEWMAVAYRPCTTMPDVAPGELLTREADRATITPR
jgi:hypothetical protein